MKYRLVVFDWDGTVMDSTSLIAECMQLAARDCDLSPPSTEAAKHIIGLGIRDSVRFLFPSLNDAGLDVFAERYRHHYVPRDGEVRLYKGIETVLHGLAHDERFLAVATGKPRRGLERAFDHCGLRHHFHYTRCADEGWPKPHPDMLEKLMAFTGVEAEQTLMIGDTIHDLNMAASAGCDGLGVSYGAHAPETLTTVPHRAVLHTVEELGNWLKQNA
ncbi:MAG: HAD-IA family hydrolase [Rhodocyclaceae bacterium]|nr:HAD-IA family hydrolase [Rhodocyclaceae bacterium]MCA3021002.1 HAD-IA family hydrolase [Rhodocyclaceae bacterium]MCA3043639.1 HAD-IA family hydrolase [Rhodocyclaceae bacterium]